jgi:hypothetical protein
MPESAYEMVYTILDWYDGARAGVADLTGKPHYYECRWDDAKDEWSEIWLLKPIDQETFRLALEDWQIWERWRAAYDEGRVTIETHPAFPEDRARHDELQSILEARLCIDSDAHIKARGDFRYGEPTLVRWTIEE